ncbi:MAG: putative universal stress protein [Pedosphaera sp.]|nr:putative universal stress protein [Pedosphaera sp.]
MKFNLLGKTRPFPFPKRHRELESVSSQPARSEATIPRFRLDRILVPTDFSPGSRAALHYAASLAQTFGAQITLLHVVPLDFSEGDFSLINYPFSGGRWLHQAQQQLAEWMERETAGPVSATTLVRLGPPVAEIVRVAAELKSDLIVLATRGHTGLSHVFLGSTTERVVRYAPCPVLTVKGHAIASQTL